VHLWSNWVLVAAIVVHALATFYHQWVLRDGLLHRMWPRGGRERQRAVAARSSG
jgi:cytochrome b561